MRRRLVVFTEAAQRDAERTHRWAQALLARAALHGRRYGDPDRLVAMTAEAAEGLT